MDTPGYLKVKIFWNKGYEVIISVHDVTNRFLSRDSNYLIDVVMWWPKFRNCSISMRKVIITSILQGFDQKTAFFEGWSWSKFNNLGLTLGTNFKFYTSVAKDLKLKVRKFVGLNPTFVEVTREILVCVCVCVERGEGGCEVPLPPSILNRVNVFSKNA